jgi:chorismate mutase/prephenate dehydratase
MDKDLSMLRSEIDEIDRQLLDLFYKRMDVCKEVADYKIENHMPAFQKGREDQIFEKVRSLSPEDCEDASVTLFSSIMEISKVLQQRKIYSGREFISHSPMDFKKPGIVGCPGTFGSNSHTAALKFFPDNEIKFYADFEDICRDLEKGVIEYGILPVHNTTAGIVNQSYELEENYNFYINSSTKVSVDHCLAVREDTDIADVKEVYSHPQALAQCSAYLKERGFEPKTYSNTALAAEMVAKSDKPIAAICSEHCASLFGLKVADCPINDVSPNFTRFISFTRDCRQVAEPDIITVIVQLPNTCGSLYKLLTKFFVNGLNMMEIESRPLKNGSFDVLFHIDFEGNLNDPKVASLLHDLANSTESFKFLGNYKEI